MTKKGNIRWCGNSQLRKILSPFKWRDITNLNDFALTTNESEIRTEQRWKKLIRSFSSFYSKCTVKFRSSFTPVLSKKVSVHNTIQNNKANYWLWAPRAGHICRYSVGVVCDLFCSWRYASRICWQTINTVKILKLMFGTGGRILETHSAEVNNIIVTESNIILMLCLWL